LAVRGVGGCRTSRKAKRIHAERNKNYDIIHELIYVHNARHECRVAA